MRRRVQTVVLALLASLLVTKLSATSAVRIEQLADTVVAAIEVEGCGASLELNRKWRTLHYRNECAQPLERKVSTFTALLFGLTASDGPATKVDSLFLGRLIHYPELVADAAVAAYRAADWDAAAGEPRQAGLGPNSYFAKLLHEAGLLRGFIDVLAVANLEAGVASVEKVLVGSPASTPVEARLLAAGVAAEARLPFDAMVWLPLQRGGAGTR